MAETKRRPRVTILERRLQNPFGEPSQSIDFKSGLKVTGRWVNDNSRASGGEIYRKKQLGWVPVTMDMVADVDSLGYHKQNESGQITRGPRGEEILMFMPESDYKQIQMAKTAENLRDMKNPGIMKKQVVEAASANLGDEAAQFLNSQLKEGAGPSGFVRDSREIISVDVEAQKRSES